MPGFNQIQQASQKNHRPSPACVFFIKFVALLPLTSNRGQICRHCHRRYLKERLHSSSSKDASEYHLHQQNPVSTKYFDGEHYFRVLHEMVGFYIRLEVRWRFCFAKRTVIVQLLNTQTSDAADWLTMGNAHRSSTCMKQLRLQSRSTRMAKHWQVPW